MTLLNPRKPWVPGPCRRSGPVSDQGWGRLAPERASPPARGRGANGPEGGVLTGASSKPHLPQKS